MKYKSFALLILAFSLIFLCSCFSKDGNKRQIKKCIMVFSPHQDDEANMANAIMYSRAKQGADVYVVMGFGSSPKDSLDEYGLGRLRESVGNLKYLGLSSSNLLYLGYQKLDYAAIGDDKLIVTNSLGEVLREDNTSYRTYSHAKEGFPSFHSIKYGSECTVSEENLLSDLTDILEQYKPDEIYTINYDQHAEHIWMGSLMEQAIGIVKSHAGFENYCPRFYQSMAYQSSWLAKKDMMTVNSPNDGSRKILESTLPFKPWNATFEWNKRVRFPVDDQISIPDVNSNLSTLAYKSGFGDRVASHLLALVNGDQIFWERDTRNKAFGATISVSSNDADKYYLNDFSTTRVPFKNVCKYSQDTQYDDNFMLNLYDCYKWIPEEDDTNKTVTLEFKNPLDIASVRLYDDFRQKNQILSGVLTFSDGSSLPVGELNNCGSATIISFPTKKRITFVRFQIKEYKGTPGLTEFEVYAPEKPRSPDFIKIYLAAANNRERKTQSFLYDYPVDVSQQPQTMQLGVYRYPDETPTPDYKWEIVGRHEGINFDTNGILRVEQSTLPGTYSIKVSESDALTDTMTINVINNPTDKSQETAEETENISTQEHNLLINGDFSDGLKGWNYDKNVAVIKEDGRNIIELTGVANDQIRIWQKVSTISGHIYRLSFELKADQSGALAIFRNDSKNEESYFFPDESVEWNVFKKDFQSSKNGVYMLFLSCKSEGKFYYSNASLIDVTKE